MFDSVVYLFTVSLPALDESVAQWFHAHLTQASSGTVMLMSDPGSPVVVGSLTVLTAFGLAWKRWWHHLAALGFAVPGGMLVNMVMKDTVCRPRPFESSPYIDLGGYSFPSAHTMAAALLYGVLAIFFISLIKDMRLRIGALALAFMLVLTVAFSRVALGAHYVTDVFAAMLASTAWLICSLRAVGILMPKPCADTGFPRNIRKS